MAAIVLGFAVLMWVWTAAGVHLVRAVAGDGGRSLQRVWLAVVLAAGAGLLAVLVLLVLPDSILGQHWTRELMERAQRFSLLAGGVAGVAGFLRGQRRLTAV